MVRHPFAAGRIPGASSPYTLKKTTQTDITSSNVRLLEMEERVEEIARMLGGVNITENTRAHAKEC